MNMTTMKKMTIGLVLWLACAAGCGGGKAGEKGTLGGNNKHGSGSQPEDVTPTLVRVSARGGDVDQAHARALAALEQALLGIEDGSLSEYAGIPSWAPGVDLRLREDGPAGGVTITLGLSRERVAEFLEAMVTHPWQANAPAAWAPVLTAAMRARIENLVCERRRALLDDQECTAPDMDAALAEVCALAESVRLRSFYKDGVPVTEDGRLLRPVSVVAEIRSDSNWLPSAGIPVVIQGEPEPLRGVSDDSGLVFATPPGDQATAWQATWPDGEVRVSVDRERMLGPFFSLWPESSPESPVDIPLRPVSRARFTLLDLQNVRGQEVDDTVFADAFARAVSAAGVAALVEIKPVVAKQLVRLPEDELAATLPEYADIWEGFIDVVVRVEVESDYASRMGAHRLWYEARAKVALYDAWSGRKIQILEHTATASGVGEERADQAARELLAGELAAKLFAAQ